MSWRKQFPEPVRLRDGRELHTLSDARALILGLTESIQHRPCWAYAVGLLIKAAETGKRDDVTTYISATILKCFAASITTEVRCERPPIR